MKKFIKLISIPNILLCLYFIISIIYVIWPTIKPLTSYIIDHFIDSFITILFLLIITVAHNYIGKLFNFLHKDKIIKYKISLDQPNDIINYNVALFDIYSNDKKSLLLRLCNNSDISTTTNWYYKSVILYIPIKDVIYKSFFLKLMWKLLFNTFEKNDPVKTKELENDFIRQYCKEKIDELEIMSWYFRNKGKTWNCIEKPQTGMQFQQDI